MKKNTLRFGMVIGCLALFGIQSLSAQQQGNNRERREPPSYAQLLEHMDADEDGRLSKEEVKGPLKNHFAQVDLNEDGFISEEEFEKAPRPKRRERNQ